VNGTITTYVYDNEDIVMEYDGPGNITTKYTHGLGIDEPLAMQQSGNTYFYHADALGSIIALSGVNGSRVQSYRYDSFGNITISGSIIQPYTFTAREYDPETGLYFYRARYYDSTQGRFLTRDPIGFAGGDVNLYAYVKNNPVNWIDPYGLFVWVNPITYWRDYGRGARDLYRNNKDMRDANTIGADKYFHCIGHCQASRQGAGGRDVSELIGEGREITDEYINNPRKGIPNDRNKQDCEEDREANRTGRDGDLNKTCKEICRPFRPHGLNEKY